MGKTVKVAGPLIIAEGMANAGYRTSRAWYYSDRPDFFSPKQQ